MNNNCTNKFSNGTVALKSILSRRKTSWLFRKKKSVRFTTEERLKDKSRAKMELKWRKYVAQQFKTLKKHKRSRWLGRGGKNKRKPCNMDGAEGLARTSTANGLEDSSSTSFDGPPPFELFQPDHKKRKKKGGGGSRENRRRPRKRKAAKARRRDTKNGKTNRSPSQEGREQGEPEAHVKRPPNAFLLFSRACRLQFKDLMVPSFESKVINMVLGHIWRFLSKQERQAFYDQAEEHRKLYKEEKQRIFPDTEHGQEELKRPLNAFMLYCQEQRAALYYKTCVYNSGRLVKIIARRWRQMKPGEKRVYMERARREQAIYKQKHSESENPMSLLPTKESCKGDADQTAAAKSLPKKMGRNNNKWYTDSSESDESRPNSTIEVKPLNGSPVHDSPLASVVIPNSPSTSSPCPRKQVIDSRPGDRKSDSSNHSDGEEETKDMHVGSTDVPTSSNRITSPVNPITSSVLTKREKRAKRKHRKEPRKTPSREKREVRWKDEMYPWDVFDPISSVLCDEDISVQLCGSFRSQYHLNLQSLCERGQHLQPDYPCVGCETYLPRLCRSCLSLGSLKNKVESAFRKSELDLANCSSSTSSACDTYYLGLLPQAAPSRSDESNMSHRLSNFHISSHGASDFCMPHPCTSSCRRGDDNLRKAETAHSPKLAKPAPRHLVGIDPDYPSSSNCHEQHLSSYPLNLESCLQNQKLLASGSVDASAQRVPDYNTSDWPCSSCRPTASQELKSRVTDSSVLKRDSTADTAKSKTHQVKSKQGLRTSSSGEKQLHDGPGRNSSKEIVNIVNRMNSVTIDSKKKDESTSRNDVKVRLVPEKTQTFETCLSSFRPNEYHECFCHSSNEHIPKMSTVSNAEDSSRKGVTPSHKEETLEGSGMVSRETKTYRGEFVRIIPQAEGHYFLSDSPRSFPSTCSMSPVLTDECMQIDFVDSCLHDRRSAVDRHASLSISRDIQYLSRVADTLTEGTPWTQQLKRSPSCQSREAANSSNNFSVLDHLSCNFAKYPHVFDEPRRGELVKAGENVIAPCNCCDHILRSYGRVETFDMQMLSDLELEYFINARSDLNNGVISLFR